MKKFATFASKLRHRQTIRNSAAGLSVALAVAMFWLAASPTAFAQDRKAAAPAPAAVTPADPITPQAPGTGVLPNVKPDDKKAPTVDCTVCHKQRQTITLPCNGLEYARHIDHGDPATACPPTPPAQD